MFGWTISKACQPGRSVTNMEAERHGWHARSLSFIHHFASYFRPVRTCFVRPINFCSWRSGRRLGGLSGICKLACTFDTMRVRPFLFFFLKNRPSGCFLCTYVCRSEQRNNLTGLLLVLRSNKSNLVTLFIYLFIIYFSELNLLNINYFKKYLKKFIELLK